MKAHVEQQWWNREWAITLYERESYFRYEDGRLHREPRTDEAAEIPPTLRLPFEALDEIVRALPGKVTANDATLDALIDARSVRDRLLTMVEKAAE